MKFLILLAGFFVVASASNFTCRFYPDENNFVHTIGFTSNDTWYCCSDTVSTNCGRYLGNSKQYEFKELCSDKSCTLIITQFTTDIFLGTVLVIAICWLFPGIRMYLIIWMAASMLLD